MGAWTLRCCLNANYTELHAERILRISIELSGRVGLTQTYPRSASDPLRT
jgi:hypothetical protein